MNFDLRYQDLTVYGNSTTGSCKTKVKLSLSIELKLYIYICIIDLPQNKIVAAMYKLRTIQI